MKELADQHSPVSKSTSQRSDHRTTTTFYPEDPEGVGMEVEEAAEETEVEATLETQQERYQQRRHPYHRVNKRQIHWRRPTSFHR
jgi:catechol-2,3-dioxygenase